MTVLWANSNATYLGEKELNDGWKSCSLDVVIDVDINHRGGSDFSSTSLTAGMRIIMFDIETRRLSCVEIKRLAHTCMQQSVEGIPLKADIEIP